MTAEMQIQEKMQRMHWKKKAQINDVVLHKTNESCKFFSEYVCGHSGFFGLVFRRNKLENLVTADRPNG